ncbi:tRNA pseudouridine(38-40) synthase TruA [Castellaniella sp. GW247-6E4]|uniref:tRNA pseudouridine(38-40) synthase TruA n=1 Tax=Castellaniella sp. GW247-6E4 TaxID=3140380 RepID=UPI0033163C84
MPRIALGLAYEGSGWNGWQTQPSRRTFQDVLESALEAFLGQPTTTICAGRTDSGVHALQQVVHLDTGADRREVSWVRGLNAHLPGQIAVQWARPVGADFHARFDARARTYFYILRSAPVRSPMLRGRVGWVHDALDENRMRAAATHLLGEHDFSAFRSSECQAASPVRTLSRLEIERAGEFLVLRFEANAFLHHMVRNLMGVLVAVGRGRRSSEWAAELLARRDRRLAAATFMPDGLYLAHVAYPTHPELPLLTPECALHTHLGWVCPEIAGHP